MENRNKLKNDIILIAALVLIGAAFAVIMLIFSKSGDRVIVRINGQVEKEFSINDEVSYKIEGAEGGVNLLVIRDGSAWLEEADCPDRLCVNMGKISKVGQSIVCLPHKVVIEIADEGNQNSEIDVYVK